MFCFRHNLQPQYQIPSVGSSAHHTYTHKSSSYPNVQNNQSPGKHRHSIGSITIKSHLQGIGVPCINFCENDARTSSRFSSQNSQFHVRFQDVEVDEKNKKQKSIDIESSLESLCLQMMEHALGP